MGYERKKMRFEILLEKYFTNFPKLLLCNLIFAVPSLSITTAFYFLSKAIFGNANVLFCMLSIFFMYPFYAGVVKVVRNIVRGDKTIPVFQVYISGVKENVLPFLLHGAVITAATMISFLSINLYAGLMSKSWIFGALLFFCIIVVVFVFFATLYLPLMTVTFDLPWRYLYKNSFLMSYGEFKNNFFATVALAVLFGIVLTIMLVAGYSIWLVVILAVLWATVLPASATFMYVFYIYDGMYHMVSGEGRLEYEKDKQKEEDKPRPAMPQVSELDFSTIDVTKLKDSDDYIFFNGKMVKQSALLKMIQEKESGAQKENENES